VLIVNEIMAGAKHFYPNEINACQPFFYQVMGVVLMRERENFTLEFTPKEDDGTLMGRRSFKLDKMHEITRMIGKS
jgi:hypothetical protein